MERYPCFSQRNVIKIIIIPRKISICCFSGAKKVYIKLSYGTLVLYKNHKESNRRRIGEDNPLEIKSECKIPVVDMCGARM
jgi:hypothetical protein